MKERQLNIYLNEGRVDDGKTKKTKDEEKKKEVRVQR